MIANVTVIQLVSVGRLEFYCRISVVL